FCQQLSVMLETGVPLAEAMEAFSQQTPSRDFREVLLVLQDDVHAGEPLSTSMMKWPRIFPSMMISLMRASEASGTMALMLGRVGEYLSKERQTARQVKGALAYPLFMMASSLAMTVFLMAFVLPRFATIYGERSATLPTPTRILLGMSNFITTEYLWYGPLSILAVVAFVIWLKTMSGRRAADWVRLNMPGLRGMYRQLYITRASRTMATLLGTGVNVLDVIDICRGVTNNAYYDRLWDTMADEIRNGRQMSDAVFQHKFVGANVASMISAGERPKPVAASTVSHVSSPCAKAWSAYMNLQTPRWLTICQALRWPPGGRASQSRSWRERRLLSSECSSGPSKASSIQ
ncbi:MAG: type II secretion system F family protein, partial [Chloroflexi bacterium]|nr:type II secretion system F family protein [Chloroflexota bacterium]